MSSCSTASPPSPPSAAANPKQPISPSLPSGAGSSVSSLRSVSPTGSHPSSASPASTGDAPLALVNSVSCGLSHSQASPASSTASGSTAAATLLRPKSEPVPASSTLDSPVSRPGTPLLPSPSEANTPSTSAASAATDRRSLNGLSNSSVLLTANGGSAALSADLASQLSSQLVTQLGAKLALNSSSLISQHLPFTKSLTTASNVADSVLGSIAHSTASTNQTRNTLNSSWNADGTDEPTELLYKWPEHGEQLVANIAQLILDQQIVDVTLACDGQQMKAHKLILSAGSSYFRELFEANPCKHPIVIMKDIAASELRSILHFIYKGELRVSHAQLPSLLKTAQMLRVRGLLDVLKQRLLDDVPTDLSRNFPTSSANNSSPTAAAAAAAAAAAVSALNQLNRPTTTTTTSANSTSGNVNGTSSAALLAEQLGHARYAAAALDFTAALNAAVAAAQSRNGLGSDVSGTAEAADLANAQETPTTSASLLAGGSSLLLPAALRADLLAGRTENSSDTLLATTRPQEDLLLDELLNRSRKRRRAPTTMPGLLRMSSPAHSNAITSGTLAGLPGGRRQPISDGEGALSLVTNSRQHSSNGDGDNSVHSTPAMLAATGLVSTAEMVRRSNGDQSADGENGMPLSLTGCSDEEMPEVGTLKKLMNQAAAALAKQQQLANLQRNASPEVSGTNRALLTRRKPRRHFAFDHLPENSENTWLSNAQLSESQNLDHEEDESEELIDVRPIVSFDEGSNIVPSIGSTEPMSDLNPQFINSLSTTKPQPPSGKICICHLCHLTFTAFSSLRRHMQRHYADRERYECDICLKSYSRKDYLKEHKKLKHSNLVGGFSSK